MGKIDLSKIYADIKNLVVGTQTTNIDTSLDSSIQNILNYRSKQSKSSYVDLVKNLIAKQASPDMSYLQGDAFGSTLSMFGQNDRFNRYKLYKSIIKMISYCKRALNILTDNTIAPNDITKVSIDVKLKNISSEEDEVLQSNIRRVRNTIAKLKIEENISEIVRNTFLYGDYFYEITTENLYLANKSFIHENVLDVADNDNSWKNTDDVITFEHEGNSISFKIENTEENFLSESQDKTFSLDDITIVYHNPATVIKLQTESMPICLGYLVFPIESFEPERQFKNQEIGNLCQQILSKLKSKVPVLQNFQKIPGLEDILSQMIRNTQTFQNVIRYIPPDKMGSFTIPSEDFKPYGESIFHACEFSAKVLIALETALAVQRLSRSTEKRKIAVEIGIPRDAKKAVELLKEQFRKRKITIDSFGSVDTIPSTITTFEDIYIPQRDGKPFVDISTFSEGMVDTQRKVDEIKFLRDQLVATFGIPAPFLNIEENSSWRTTLTEENILFARTVVSYQKLFSHQIQEMIHKVFQIVMPEDALTIFDNIIVALPPPQSLQFERQSKYISDAVSMIQSMNEIGIPKEYAAQKYLSQIDWNDIKQYKINQEIEKKISNNDKDSGDNDESGMGGGF